MEIGRMERTNIIGVVAARKRVQTQTQGKMHTTITRQHRCLFRSSILGL